MERFPLDSLAYDYQDYFQAREGGHHGTDIFAPRGTVVQAVEKGLAHTAWDPKGGNVVYLNADSGWRYYYAHLEEFSPQILDTPTRVVEGQALGKVGSSGNAQGKAPHLHFQVKDAAGKLLDPFRYLREVDPHYGGKWRWPWQTPTVGPGKTSPTGVAPKTKPEPWALDFGQWLLSPTAQYVPIAALALLWYLSREK